MTADEINNDIANRIIADPSRTNLERCLERIRENGYALAAAQAHMDNALYDLLRAREMTEALQETNQDIEARIYLLLGALGD